MNQYQIDVIRSTLADLQEDIDQCDESLRRGDATDRDISLLLESIQERGADVARTVHPEI